MTVPPTDPRRGSTSRSSPDGRPPGWDPRARSASGDRNLPLPPGAPARGESGRLAESLGPRDVQGSGVARTRRLGPYRILSLIAQGGMGAVYEALHEGLGRMVALKTMLPSAAISAEDVERFLREAKAASRLAHPNLVPIYDVGEAEGVRYLAMELVRGQTLHDRIRQSGHLEEAQAVAVMIGAAEGLAHAHEAGILHRDLKPANIILQADGTPRLTDFGVAKAMGESRLTATGTALGTPNYMSPEQAMGMNQELDARTDVWGLGAILYECLTGQPPFNEGSHVATMQAVVGRPVASPRALAADLSRDLEAIVLKCLAREREERYPSCQELLRDLRACQAGRTIRARAPGLVLRAARRLRRNALIASLATLACGSLAALAVALLSARPGDRADQAARRWLEEQRAALEAAGTSPGALESLAAELDEPARGEALAQAARAELRRLRAELALRRAGEAGPQAGALLARAALEDPLGPAGRSARAALAARLAGAAGPLRRELHLAELRALCAGTEDGVADGARGALLDRLLGQARWEEALPLAPAGDPRRALAAALAPAVRLEADRALALPGAGGPGLLLLRRRELVRTSMGAGGAVSDPTPLLTCAEPPALLTAVRGQGLLVTPGPDRRASLQLIPPPAPGAGEAGPLPPARAGVPFSLEDAPLTWAGGDFDGDGAPDLACVPWERPFYAVAASSSPAGPAWWRVFAQGEEPLPYMVGAAGAADLDGDGRDELILASSALQPLGVMARRLDPAGRTFRSVATLGMPAAVSLLSSWPLDGRRQGVLAVVDWRAGNDVHLFDRPRRAGAAPWEGRDGLYLLEQAGEQLELRGRWTYGPDEPPVRGAAALAEGIQAWVMRLGGEAWVARAAELEAGARLELVRLARLLEGGLESAVEAELSLELAELPAGPPQVLDADGDGEDELVWGGALLGAGLPRVAPLAAETDEGAARARLGRLVAAAAPEASGELIARLEVEHPDLAPAARLATAEVPLELALEARAAASALLARGLPEPGRRRWAEGEALLQRSGEAALALATRAEVPARERAEAALLAEEAWGRLGRREQAAAALERDPSAGLPPGLRERLAQARSRLRPGELAGAWEPAFRPGPPPLAPLAPLGCRPGEGGSGLELDVCGHRLQAATAPLELPGGPVTLEASLRLVGPVWVGRVEVGFFSPDGPLGEARFTGVEVGLWDVYADRPSLALHVQGANTGRLGALPTYRGRLRLRLQLDPLPPGGLRVGVTISDPEERLLLAAERVAPASLSGQVRVGLRCPVYFNRDTAAQESPGFGALGAVALEGLRVVSAPAPRRLEPGALERGHAALCAGDARAAEAAYDQALADPRPGAAQLHAARWHRALARGRQERADAHEDLVQAAREDPLATLLLFEDAADALLFGPADDRRTVARALEALARDEDPLLRGLAAGLRGQVPGAGDLSRDAADRQLALAYAMMMGDPAYRPEKFALPGRRERELRLPRRPWSPTLDFPLEPPDEAEGAAAQRQDQAPRARERALVRLVAREPGDALRWLDLAGLWLTDPQAGSPGRAERALRRATELASSAAQRHEAWLTLVMQDLQRGLYATALEDLERAGLPRAQLDQLLGALRGEPRLEAFLSDPALARIRDQAR